MFTFLKTVFFAKTPKKPPTKEEIQKRRDEFVKSFVCSHAEGNVSLSRGLFTLKRK